MKRFAIFGCAAVLAVSAGYVALAQQKPGTAAQKVTVYKTPT